MSGIKALEATASEEELEATASIPSALNYNDAAALSMAFLGSSDFQYYRYTENGHWCVFSTKPFPAGSRPQISSESGYVSHFHGTTLWQAWQIIEQGFRISFYKEGTITSPLGLWGTTHPGDSLDRAHVARGWTCQRTTLDYINNF